jgi:uncharacterized protein (UPF0332 family)
MNENIQKYLQKSLDCLSDAEYLLEGNRLEASCNRSYYAIFDAIQALLIDKDITTKSHQGAHTKFREIFIKTSLLPLQLSEILTESFSSRQGRDYDSDFEISKDDVKRIFTEATFFVKTVRDYLTAIAPS